jgi:hypothetical protein
MNCACLEPLFPDILKNGSELVHKLNWIPSVRRRWHLFVDVQCAGAPGGAGFSPSELVTITHAAAADCSFTMSANGVTHVTADGTTEHFGLDQWTREDAIFKRLKKLKMVRRFPLWKMVRIWRQRCDARLTAILTLPGITVGISPASIALSLSASLAVPLQQVHGCW